MALFYFLGRQMLEEHLQVCFRERIHEGTSRNPAAFGVGRGMDHSGLQRATNIAAGILQLHGEERARRKLLTKNHTDAGRGNIDYTG